MAAVSQFNLVSCKTFLPSPKNPISLPRSSVNFRIGSIKPKPQTLIREFARSRPSFKVQAAKDEDWSSKKEEDEPAEAEVDKPEEESEKVEDTPAVPVVDKPEEETEKVEDTVVDKPEEHVTVEETEKVEDAVVDKPEEDVTEEETEKVENAVVDKSEEDVPEVESEIESLKKTLVNLFSGSDRGCGASWKNRAEIDELINGLEAKNPTPAPTEALSLLNGKWILAYTSFAGLSPLLLRNTCPLVRIEEISQTIDSENLAVQNSVKFTGLLTSTSVTTNNKFEVRSPKRVQIKFVEGIIGTPQLTDSLVVPESVEYLGQKVDLTLFKSLITSTHGATLSIANTISTQLPFKFSFPNCNAESWLLTTYLDEELRISRSDAGGVFVLIKEGSSLLLKP